MKPTGVVVVLVMLTCFFLAFVSVEGQPCQPIQSRSFKDCECNILGACNVDGNVNQDNNPTLDGYAPSGIEQFGYVKGGVSNLAYLCEGGTVAILYDCNARIPLYATTVMTGAQLYCDIGNRPSDFKTSKHLHEKFQQSGDDYDASAKRHLCYETSQKKYFVESDWLNAAESQNVVGQNQPCCAPNVLASAVHKGHPLDCSSVCKRKQCQGKGHLRVHQHRSPVCKLQFWSVESSGAKSHRLGKGYVFH